MSAHLSQLQLSLMLLRQGHYKKWQDGFNLIHHSYMRTYLSLRLMH